MAPVEHLIAPLMCRSGVARSCAIGESRRVADLLPVLADLSAESADLDAHVSALPDETWATPTPAAGWTIAHQIAHLAWTDEAAALATTDPAAFQVEVGKLAADMEHAIDGAAAARAAQSPAVLLAGWRDARSALADALLGNPVGSKIGWFGPPMTATSMATARLMETWAHGQDVVDALGVTRLPTSRLRHIARIGIRTRDFAYRVHGRTPPTEEFGVDLLAPDGTIWSWGPYDAAQRVSGPALDFCLRVTQRRHRDDLSLVAIGDDANAWLDIAQAFAGPPGVGREAGSLI